VLILNAEIDGRGPLDVRLKGSRIERIADRLAAEPREPTLDAGGGALLPGLHDHHIHVLALAAALRSVPCGPPDVRDRAALQAALRAAAEPLAPGAWLRGVGYHESIAGRLDRDALDALLPSVPLRVQHRSGALWMLNSAAIEALGPGARDAPEAAERDEHGRLTGRLFRLDGWLQSAIGAAAKPDLTAVGSRLAAFGVTGLTDATPGNDDATLSLFEDAVTRGALPQRVVMMGGPHLPEGQHGEVARGPLKILLDDVALPDFDDLSREVAQAHGAGRAVAFHCVTRTQLVFALTVLEAAGDRPGDRIEHAAIAPPDLLDLLRARGVTVVTQPNFIRERGDVYVSEVSADERPWLYRCRGFLDAGVPLAAGTDAPFGSPDPWLAMQAAVDRRSEAGLVLGEREGVSPERALAMFTTTPQSPGGRPRAVAAQAVADLCLLSVPWKRAREALSSHLVRATFRAGRLVP